MASTVSPAEILERASRATPASGAAALFNSGLKPIWCPGCGSYGVLGTLRKALALLGLRAENIMITSGIGCSSRMAAYMGTYGFHTIHGRAVPIAIGGYLANPGLTHVVVGGDGDIFSIGGGHLPHLARRNPKITVFALDNEIYGLTKGQASPTTPVTTHSKSMPIRPAEQPLNPGMLCLAYDVSFFARAYAGRIPEMLDVMIQAIAHPGAAIVQIYNPCLTFNDMRDPWGRLVAPLPAGHDTADRMAAMTLASSQEPLYTGIYYRSVRPTLLDTVNAVRSRVSEDVRPDIEELIEQYA
jgi:2-oxoglutarate/2-oxoacid ferredoxin oxidoreductase subunit beta